MRRFLGRFLAEMAYSSVNWGRFLAEMTYSSVNWGRFLAKMAYCSVNWVRFFSAEQKAKIRQSLTGREFSAEHKVKLSQSRRKRGPDNEATREKKSLGALKRQERSRANR